MKYPAWTMVQLGSMCHEMLARLLISSSVLTLPTTLQEEKPLSRPGEKRQRRKK